MKKKMIAMVVVFLLTVTNTSMAHALSPVAEVYYNIGTIDTYDPSDFESQLNDAIKAKLQAGGVNPKYVSIMDASANPVDVEETHVHSGYESWYNATPPEVETADYNHVQITNDGKTLTFYGYTAPAYKDFMLTSGTPSGKKIITFDMDESKVDYHSMEGGGFLFNTKIDSEGKLSGYAILYIQGAINVYMINGVNADALHNEPSRALSAMTDVVTRIGTYTKGASTQHSIKINVTDTALNMWDNGEQIIKNLALPEAYGDEFGPIVSHISHGCQIISIFSFDNMKLFSTSTKTLGEAVKDIAWDTYSPLRYVVNINEDPTEQLDDLKGSFNSHDLQYVGISDEEFSEISQDFIDEIDKGGLYVNSGESAEDIIEAIANRVAEQIINDYKEAIHAIETAEDNTDILFNSGDTKNSVRNNITLQQGENVTTIWSSDQPSVIDQDGNVTRPVTAQSGTYVTLKATITEGGLTSEKTFTVFVKAADPAPVSNLSAVAGNRQVTLSFPALLGATDIIVEQSTDGNTFTPAVTSEVLDASSTSATVTGLTNGTTYHIRLTVVSGPYEGPSNVVTVKPVAPYVNVVETPTMKADVIVSDQANGGKVVQEKITKLIGDNLNVTGKIISANGQEMNVPKIEMNEDGSFTLPKVAPGEYKLSMNVIAPNGEKLAGPAGKLIVDSDGKASLSVDLVDPYGTILDTITNKPVTDVNMKLYWADTELNRSKGRVPGTLVNLPELPDFSPNKNHNPQISSDSGEYGWMVYADGDYYFLGEKDGYVVFDSRNDKREEAFGDDSFIKDGIIHVGDTIVKFSFSAQPKVKAAGDHSPYMVGYPDGTFQPDRGILRAEVAAILSRLYTSAASSNQVSYSDVSANHWATDAISVATNNKWMVGSGDNTFKPKKQITRAEFAQILANVYKWDAATESTYTDVAGHWAEQAIATAEKQGALSDFTQHTFNPNQPITRVEAIRIFNKLLNRNPWHIEAGMKWTDVPEGYEYYSDIMEASIPHAFEQFETGIESWKE
ncbi:S-layer homology domain-containing protein [Paenibacillus sp. IITD108]